VKGNKKKVETHECIGLNREKRCFFGFPTLGSFYSSTQRKEREQQQQQRRDQSAASAAHVRVARIGSVLQQHLDYQICFFPFFLPHLACGAAEERAAHKGTLIIRRRALHATRQMTTILSVFFLILRLGTDSFQCRSTPECSKIPPCWKRRTKHTPE
jgi:hypothetical protein